MPSNDVNCPPFDYFKYGHIEIQTELFTNVLKVKCPITIPKEWIRKFVHAEIDKELTNLLNNSVLKPEIHQLLTDDTISYKQQNALLRNIEFNSTDLLWLNKEAQDLGYLLDVYYEEKYPTKFEEKKHPLVIHQKDEETIKSIGNTDMTEGEMKALLQQRKVIQARIYHKHNIWHCFYFTFRGLAGEERGAMGGKPHYHYLSDKKGISWSELMYRIKACDMPSSDLHIVIKQ